MIKLYYISLILAFLNLSGCASDDPRYQDLRELERPPDLPIDKQAAAQAEVNEVEAPLKHYGKGLKSDVYLVEGPPLEMRLKRGLDESWSLINRAIQLNELKVPDQDRSKGVYYVEFGGTGLLSNVLPFIGTGNKATYEMKVEPQNNETRVTVNMVARKEDSDTGAAKDGFAEPAIESKASQLLNLLYDTLHDKVKED